MALLKVEYDFNQQWIKELAKQIPDFNSRFLSLVGKRSRTLLKTLYLSGQEIDLRKYPVDSRGRYTITSDVNRKQDKVKIYSYPVNLFEKGRRLRSGRQEAGKFIITKKLKQAVMMKMAGYTKEFEEIIEPEVSKL